MNKKLDKEKRDIAQATLAVTRQKRKEIDAIDIKLELLLDSYLDQDIDQETYKQKKLELVGKKKRLEEQITQNQRRQGSWIEPMRSWIFEASQTDQTISGSDWEAKKVLLTKIFGSNLYLEEKKARGEAQMPWSALHADPTARTKAPTVEGCENFLH